MSVKKEENGRRSVEIAVELQATPEAVWDAIASESGLSAWFVPAVFEQHDGKPVAVTLDFGGGMQSRSVVTEWRPLHVFSREGAGWAPGSPPLATEFHIETRDGGVCVLRIVQSLFASTDAWDAQLTGAEEGWPGITRILRLYLTHFSGQPSAIMRIMAPVPGTPAEAWSALTSAMGLAGVGVGQQWSVPADAPSLSGIVEHVTDHPFGALLRLETPTLGIAAVGTIKFGKTVMATLTCYLYGESATDTVASETPRWQSWIQQRLPMPAS
ncbi:MAG: SRPBCC domain-containing protein [Gemmatimonadaceae bacterium]|nr:SRPBCC domain-containing protein [Gemmatimonadaceae bacterium]